VSEVRQGLGGITPKRSRLLLAGVASLALATTGIAYGSTLSLGDAKVGDQTPTGQVVSADQTIAPLGDRLMTPFGKMMASSVSPDGKYLAASSTDRSYALQVFDLATYQPIAMAGTASTTAAATAISNAGFSMPYQRLANGSVGQGAPVYSPDGSSLWVGQKDQMLRFPVNADGTIGTPTAYPLAPVGTTSALPGKPAFSADGSQLFIPLNGQNTVVAMDAATGAVTHTWDVGVAPREVALVGSKLYVSNEGGRRAQAGDETMTSYGTDVVADGHKGTSTTGTVSVIDTTDATATPSSIPVELHPTSLYADGSTLYVANTNSDTVSVVDTRSDQVVQTIATQPWPSSDIGYAPTGMTVTDGHLLVTLGRANAVAVYRLGSSAKDPVRYVGLLPTDYFPEDISDVAGKLYVTNTRGIDARGPALTFKPSGTTPATGHGTHSTTASLTRFTLPSDADVAAETPTVFAQNGWTGSDVIQKTGAPAAPMPVPRRIGDPSTIKHVFLLVKENRTYDQVYGDMPQGNGDPTLTQFGEQVTPNQHALARQFGLYDNVYDIGTNSAEGHNWLMQGDNPEYTESSAGEYQRSYDTEEDVLGHQRSGFLWTAIEDAGHTARNYGEFEYTEGKPSGTWQQYYCATKSVEEGGDPAQLTSPELKGDYGSLIPSLDAISNRTSPPFDLAIPDIYRSAIWKQDFQANGPADFNMVWLSSDHTGGTAGPRAQVADGDLAVGRIVDAISHSPYWKDSVIVVAEDDSQNGADHVDGHRAPIQVISPWAQHGKVIHRFYSQISMVRTIEQILGAQPLNQKVAAATPMYDAFTNKPDNTPFTAVPNQVPLTEGVAVPPACGLDTLGTTGTQAAKVTAAAADATAVPSSEQATADAWTAWIRRQNLTGNGAEADSSNPEQMNRWTWYSTHHFQVAYPGDARILLPSEVPGGTIPSPDND
jgi:YVTN family beta-propeller protein